MDKEIKELLLLSNTDYESMNIAQRKEYYKKLRDYLGCFNTDKHDITLTQRIITMIGPLFRN